MSKYNKKVEQIQRNVDGISKLKEEARYISDGVVVRKKRPEAKVEFYTRSWESIVVKVKK